jgi:hypothetical protein
MELLLGLSVLIALWLYIRYDQKRIKTSTPEPISRETMQRGFTPGASIAWKGQAGGALVGVIGSASQFISPSLPPFTGRWSFFHGAVYTAMGKYGLAIFWAAFAVVIALTAYRKYKATQVEASSNNAA